MAQNAPPGMASLIELCHSIYPDQPNPLQVTTVVKYWLGGQDPLDYISMYSNPGNLALNIPPHWHYVSFGLSDLHGDGRVHIPEITGLAELRSGMGFELTFRLLKKEPEGAAAHPDRPPTWPANLLQALARYVFQTGNRLCVGDNVPWRKALDNSQSKIQNLLIGEDPQLPRIETPFGWVDFCQIVGVTSEELEQASRWNGKGILNILKNDPATGGEYMITDMDRSNSVFEMFPETFLQLEIDLEREGSDLAGVNAEFTYKENPRATVKKEFFDLDSQNPVLEEEDPLAELFLEMKQENLNNVQASTATLESPFPSYINNSQSIGGMSCPLDSQELPSRVVHLEGLELTLAPYAGKFLILAIRDRIRHGRHFTFKSPNMAVTFVAESVTGSVVSRENPYGVLGYWIQVMIPDYMIPRMLEALQPLDKTIENFTTLPLTFEWNEMNLRIVIDNPMTFSTILKEEGAN